MSWIYEHRDDMARKASRRGEILSAAFTAVFTLGCFGLAAGGAYSFLSRHDLSQFAFFGARGGAVAGLPSAGDADKLAAESKAAAQKSQDADGVIAGAHAQPERYGLREPARAESKRPAFTELPRR